MRPIKEGDIVDVAWVIDGEALFSAKVLHMPSDVGDLMYVENNGTIYGINTSCSNFQCVVKAKVSP